MISTQPKPLPTLTFDFNSNFYPLIEQKAMLLELREGASIMYPGQVHDSIYILKKGILRSYASYPKAGPNRWFFSPGDLAFAPVCFFHELPSDICLEAACASVVVQISKTDFYQLCQDLPALKTAFNSLQAHFLYRYARFNDLIKMLPHLERYKKFLEEFPGVGPYVQVRHVSSFLGMTPETLSKIRKQMQKQSSKNSTIKPPYPG